MNTTIKTLVKSFYEVIFIPWDKQHKFEMSWIYANEHSKNIREGQVVAARKAHGTICHRI